MSILCCALLFGPGAWALPAPAQSCVTEQANLTSTASQPVTNSKTAASISADGGTVGWTTSSSNVVPGDVNGWQDVFVTNRSSGAVELVSLAWDGAQGNDRSGWHSLSSNGNIVVFDSRATNLVPGPPALYPGIYVRDRAAGTTERIDGTPAGTECAPWGSVGGRTSGSGRFVVFSSTCSDLVADDANGFNDAFLRDRASGVTELLSVALGGGSGNFHSYANDVTPDGRWVVFNSLASDIVAGDTKPWRDVFLRDRVAGVTTRVSLNSSGVQANRDSLAGEASSDGRWVLFQSKAGNLAGTTKDRWQVYLRDVAGGTTVLVSVGLGGAEGDADSTVSAISPDGRYALFTSLASNLVPGDTNGNTDVFRRDLVTGTTELVNVTAAGTIPIATSYASSANGFSADGRSFVFLSSAPNITSPPDPNGQTDVFVRTCVPADPETYCVAEVNSLGCTPAIGFSGSPSATAGSGFEVTLANTVSQKVGLFFYGVQGPRLAPFQGGYGCVRSPVRRTPLRSSGGNAGPDCSGLFSIDLNAWIAGGSAPDLAAGQSVWGQWWSRDSSSAFNTNVSDAVALVIGP